MHRDGHTVNYGLRRKDTADPDAVSGWRRPEPARRLPDGFATIGQPGELDGDTKPPDNSFASPHETPLDVPGSPSAGG
jgi:hypothetical protein